MESLRLAKPKKKGLLPLIFSRLFLIALLIALQILLIVGIFLHFSNYIPHFTALQEIFTLVMLLYLFSCDMDASAKLTWMLVLMLFPVPGSIFLAYTRNNFGNRLVKNRVAEMIDRTRQSIAQDEAVIDTLAKDRSGMDDLHRYINRSGCMPVFANTEVT